MLEWLAMRDTIDTTTRVQLLDKLERASALLEPSSTERLAVTDQVVSHLEHFLQSNPEAPAFVQPTEAIATISELGFPEHGRDLSAG